MLFWLNNVLIPAPFKGCNWISPNYQSITDWHIQDTITMAVDRKNNVSEDNVSHHAKNQSIVAFPKPRSVTEAATDPDEPEWLQGFPLLMIMTAITLVCYLMLLDASIISTVCQVSVTC